MPRNYGSSTAFLTKVEEIKTKKHDRNHCIGKERHFDPSIFQ